MDQWNIGYLPAVFSTDIRIELLCGDSNLSEPKIKYKSMKESENSNAWDGGWTSSSPDLVSRSGLLSTLKMLFGSATGTWITVHITPADSASLENALIEQERICDIFVSFILPLLDPLQATGCKIRVVIADRSRYGYPDDFVLERRFTLESCKDEFKEVSFPETNWQIQAMTMNSIEKS